MRTICTVCESSCSCFDEHTHRFQCHNLACSMYKPKECFAYERLQTSPSGLKVLVRYLSPKDPARESSSRRSARTEGDWEPRSPRYPPRASHGRAPPRDEGYRPRQEEPVRRSSSQRDAGRSQKERRYSAEHSYRGGSGAPPAFPSRHGDAYSERERHERDADEMMERLRRRMSHINMDADGGQPRRSDSRREARGYASSRRASQSHPAPSKEKTPFHYVYAQTEDEEGNIIEIAPPACPDPPPAYDEYKGRPSRSYYD